MCVCVCVCVCMYVVVCVYICYFLRLASRTPNFQDSSTTHGRVIYDPRSGHLRPMVGSSTTHGRVVLVKVFRYSPAFILSTNNRITVVENGMCVFFDCPKLRNTRARRR